MFRLTLILNCVFLAVLGASFGPKCKLDRACATKQISDIYKTILEDENNQLDPIHVDRLDVDLGSLKYTITDVTTTGFKMCSVKDANLDLDKLKCEVDLYCPEIHAAGMYDAHGSLIGMPVEGNGGFTIDTKDNGFKIRMDLSLTTKDDKHYLHIDKYNADSTAFGDVVYDIKNLFNGQKDLADSFLKFVDKNLKAIANEMERPLLSVKFQKVVDAANEFLNKEPLETFLIL